MLNSEMCSVRRYSKAILFCSLTNPRFMSLTALYLGTMQIDNQTIGPFPILFLLSEISYSIILDFFFFKEHLKKILSFKFILDSSIFKLEVQIVMILSSGGT